MLEEKKLEEQEGIGDSWS